MNKFFRLFAFLRLRDKLLVPTALAVVTCVVVVLYAVNAKSAKVESERMGALNAAARTIQDKIDRNLFERYGDVQAFALNTVVHRDLGALSADERDAITYALNGYVTGYGCYSLAVITDPAGTVVAVNSVDAGGKTITAPEVLLGKKLSETSWYQAVRTNRFTTYDGEGALTGTFVEGPHVEEFTKEIYRSRAPSWNMTFSAPIRDQSGKLCGYWHNVFASDVVEEIAVSEYSHLVEQGIHSAEITVLDAQGRIIVDVDPSYRGTTEPQISDLFTLNLATGGVELASEGIRSSSAPDGNGRSRHKRKSDALGENYMQVGAYARSVPTLGYVGSKTVTLVRAEEKEVFQVISSLLSSTLVSGMVVLVLTVTLMYFLFDRVARTVRSAAEAIGRFSNGDLTAQLEVHSGDEIGQLGKAFNEACSHLRGVFDAEQVKWEDLAEQRAEANSLKTMVENAPINIMVADTDLVIRYMNPASLRTMDKVRDALPVPPEEIVGQCIDIFHKNPAVQRKIVSDPRNLPHRAKFRFGTQIMDLQASPIHDEKGRYLGPMVTWAIVTEQEERAQREKDLLRKMSEHSQTVSASSEELSVTAREMSQGSEHTTQQAESVAAACEEVSRNIATVATSAEEMNASVKEIARNSSEAARVATQAVRAAQATNGTISKLGESSVEIGEVIKVITSIAEQTNLLALNATIEAARAGEAGKGFAVVANEVKELAKQTAAATDGIARKVEAIQVDTSSAVAAIGEITTVIGQINDIQTTIASAVEEQSATTNEIARNASEAAKGSDDITRGITAVSHTANVTAEGTRSTLAAAQELAQLASDLQAMVKQGQLGEVAASSQNSRVS